MIKNCVSQKLLAEIPKGKDAASRNRRKSIIERELSVYVDKVFRNRYLSNGIKCLGASVGEIALWASKNYYSTVAALHLKQAILYSSVLYIDLPKDGKQMKKFKAWITIIMHCDIEGVGTVKFTIVDSLKNEPGKGEFDLLAYCLTKEKETV